MSRIGSKPIEIPEGVTVMVKDRLITVKGVKGELNQLIRPEIRVEVKDKNVIVSKKIESDKTPAYWGLTRALIANMIEGVLNGYSKKLEMVGVGYRVKKESDSKISLTVGYSHPVIFEAPEGVKLDTEENNIILISGINKQLVGLTAAQIRKIRKPEVYKGKGIRYDGEVVRRKAGKAGIVA